MNRAQKRKMEKQLGITKKHQSLTTAQKIQETSQNVKAGRRKNEEMAETRKKQENEENDKIISAKISSLATTIMIRDDVEWYQALESAKVEIEKEYSTEA